MLLNKNNETEYLRIMKIIAKDAGYNPDELQLANDGRHKLEINGIKFGHIDYPDFVLFLINGEYDEAYKRRRSYLIRTAKMKGDWKNDKFSKNNLARRIIWFSNEKK
jgi:hypothetical protein